MQMLLKKSGILVVVMIACFTFTFIAWADDYEPVKSLVEKYHSGNPDKAKAAVNKLSHTEPKTHEDMHELRKMFSGKAWDERLYGNGVGAIEKVKDPSLDDDLIEILKDEKPLMEKITPSDFESRSEKELAQRSSNIINIIKKLGEHKSQNAVPVLKDYLKLKGFKYFASEALGKIGDKSASEEIRERAYKGEEVNYGGMGLEEANTIIRDLQNESKKDKWKKMANQLINIRNAQAKENLIKLFDHKDGFVRRQASTAFSNMVNKDDVKVIIDMTRNPDWWVRSQAVLGMMRVKEVLFDDNLIKILVNDKHPQPRAQAARALGYKKIQKAVPYLERELNNQDYYVRLESFIALYALTNNKYDFKGRDKTADSMADKQSKYPSIYW